DRTSDRFVDETHRLRDRIIIQQAPRPILVVIAPLIAPRSLTEKAPKPRNSIRSPRRKAWHSRRTTTNRADLSIAAETSSYLEKVGANLRGYSGTIKWRYRLLLGQFRGRDRSPIGLAHLIAHSGREYVTHLRRRAVIPIHKNFNWRLLCCV